MPIAVTPGQKLLDAGHAAAATVYAEKGARAKSKAGAVSSIPGSPFKAPGPSSAVAKKSAIPKRVPAPAEEQPSRAPTGEGAAPAGAAPALVPKLSIPQQILNARGAARPPVKEAVPRIPLHYRSWRPAVSPRAAAADNGPMSARDQTRPEWNTKFVANESPIFKPPERIFGGALSPRRVSEGWKQTLRGAEGEPKTSEEKPAEKPPEKPDRQDATPRRRRRAESPQGKAIPNDLEKREKEKQQDGQVRRSMARGASPKKTNSTWQWSLCSGRSTNAGWNGDTTMGPREVQKPLFSPRDWVATVAETDGGRALSPRMQRPKWESGLRG